MVSKANELFIAPEQILDIFEDGLLLDGGRRVVPLEKFTLRLHRSATSSEEKIVRTIF